MRLSLIFFTFFTLLVSPLTGYSNDFDNGIQAFEHEQYSYAAKMFFKSTKSSPNNLSAYYNLGLSHMGENRYGKAIWAFEKLLAQNPNDIGAKRKIEECSTELNHEYLWKHHISGIESAIYRVSLTSWAILSIFFSILIALSLIGYRKTTSTSTKRVLLLILVSFMSVFSLSIYAGYKSKRYYEQSNYAVVTKLNIPIYLDKKNKSNSQLPEGTLVQRLNQDSIGIVPVKTMNGEDLWVKFKDLSVI